MECWEEARPFGGDGPVEPGADMPAMATLWAIPPPCMPAGFGPAGGRLPPR